MGIDLLNVKYQKQKAVILTDVDGRSVELEENGSVPVTLQDPTTPIIIAEFRKEIAPPTTLTADVALNSNVIQVTSAAGMQVGYTLLFRNPLANRYGFAKIITINALTITLDSPADYAWPAASTTIGTSITNMAVNGNVTPQTFSIRAGSSPQIATTADITRMIFSATCTSAVDLSLFGNLPALLKGIVIRHSNGIEQNLFNIKKNLDLATLAYDFSVYSATNPAQGLYGFTCRLTFAGQNKMGVVIRVAPDEDLECIIQDDLTGLTSFNIVAEGHVVTV